MNTRIAKKIRARVYPRDIAPTEQMVRAERTFQRALRRGSPSDARLKWHVGPITEQRARREADRRAV